MLKKIKYISITTIALFYILQLSIVFSGSLIENIQHIRHQNQVSKIHLTAEKTIPLKVWNNFDDKKEIKINAIYYDVVSFKILSDSVVIKVVKDNFESELRISMQRLFDNKSLPSTDKKKCFNFYNYLSIIETQKKEYTAFLISIGSNPIKFFLQGKTNNIISTIYRPPC